MILETAKLDEMRFHDQTDTFGLTLTLADSKLAVTLEDYVDWAVYEKSYSEDVAGKDIHKKMDLIDVYIAFSQTRPQQNDKIMTEKQSQVRKLRQYEFGTIVENEKLPCYKIQRQGKITTYLNMMNRQTKSEVTYQSKLSLIKVRDMSQAEIYMHKQKMSISKLVEKTKGITIKSSIDDIHGLPQKNSNQFSINGPKVKYTGKYKSWTNYMFNIKILQNDSAKFRLKVIKMGAKVIYIGIVNYTKQKNSISSYDSGNAICYNCNGQKYPGKEKNEDNRFRVGDVVGVEVDRKNCMIRYSVNGVMRASYTEQMLGDAESVFVPFVEMFSVGNEVKWVQ